MRYPLVDGQGNFGSVDGDSAAAMRYTEARRETSPRSCCDDIDKDTVDFAPNYDGSEKSRWSCRAAFPNLLVNGAAGIAVGMATNIPPHNLDEVIDATIVLIDNPDCTVDELMEVMPGPDFPTAGSSRARRHPLRPTAPGGVGPDARRGPSIETSRRRSATR